ncbi:MAG: aminotransferase class I/II-fold pyridoxal phosphate-dependent enzyme, partial [Pseudomonadota bacterium]
YFESGPPPSILEVEGGRDVAIEFTSMSKTFSMAGWRMGFAVGNERMVGALTRVKSYLDYGAFTPIQVAAIAALDGPEADIAERRAMYRRRRDVLIESFGRAGWDLPVPKASMYVWAPVPERFAHMGAMGFAKALIERAGVAVSPGVGFGDEGEAYVRIAFVENEQRIRQAARQIRAFFADG